MTFRELVRAYPIARRLPIDFPPGALVSDLEKLGPEWWHGHAGPYHDGGWESVSLWAPRGDPFEQRSFGGAFAATPALLKTPAIQELLDRFPVAKNRVRLMRLNPGGRIFAHRDPLHTIDPALVRLHVPVTTHDRVVFTVDGVRVVMNEGETWHVDVRFVHAVENLGDTPRVHLVMDLARDPMLEDLLGRGEAVGSGRLTGYFARESLPVRIRRLFFH